MRRIHETRCAITINHVMRTPPHIKPMVNADAILVRQVLFTCSLDMLSILFGSNGHGNLGAEVVVAIHAVGLLKVVPRHDG